MTLEKRRVSLSHSGRPGRSVARGRGGPARVLLLGGDRFRAVPASAWRARSSVAPALFCSLLKDGSRRFIRDLVKCWLAPQH